MAGRTFEIKARLTAEDKASRVLRQSERAIESFSDVIANNLVVTLGDLQRVAGEVIEGLREAFNFQAQERAFRQSLANVDQDFDSFIAKLRQVSNSTLDTSELIQSSSQALLLGIPADKIADLLEVARVRAVQTGRATAQAFNDITTGIGRASPLILDNLGITVKLGDAYEKMAEQVGKSAEQLTESEKKQALLNEVLRIGSEDLDSYETALTGGRTELERFSAILADANIAAGQFGASVVENVGVLEQFNNILEIGVGAFLQQERAQDKTLTITRKLIGELALLEKEMSGVVGPSREFAELQGQAEPIIERLARLLGTTSETLKNLASTYGTVSGAAERFFNVLDRQAKAANEAAEADEQLLKSLRGLGIVLEEDVNKAFEKNEQLLNLANDAYRRGIINREDFERAERAVVEQEAELLEQLFGVNEQFQEMNETTQRGTTALRQFRTEVRQTNEELQALQQTSQLGSTIDRFGKRQIENPIFGPGEGVSGGTFTTIHSAGFKVSLKDGRLIPV